MIAPRTPQEYFTAENPIREGKGPVPRLFFKKVGRGGTANPWVISISYAKSLILEATTPAGYMLLSTGCHQISTGCANFPTGRFFRPLSILSIYLFKKKEERRIQVSKKALTTIHGLAELLKKASTGYDHHPRVFRGCQWMVIYLFLNRLSMFLTTIHASTGCNACGYFLSLQILGEIQ